MTLFVIQGHRHRSVPHGQHLCRFALNVPREVSLLRETYATVRSQRYEPSWPQHMACHVRAVDPAVPDWDLAPVHTPHHHTKGVREFFSTTNRCVQLSARSSATLSHGLRSLGSLHMQPSRTSDQKVQPVHWTKDPRAGTDASPVPLTPNQHWTVDPESGERVVAFDFTEEPLGMPESIGYGFAQFEFGESLGGNVDNHCRSYTVLRKLGWGMNSSTWLVQDQRYCILLIMAPSIFRHLS